MREVREQIGFGDGRAGGSNTGNGGKDGLAQPGEEAFFNFNRPLVSGQHLDLVFPQLRRGKPLGVG
jgi:hypothetical protein